MRPNFGHLVSPWRPSFWAILPWKCVNIELQILLCRQSFSWVWVYADFICLSVAILFVSYNVLSDNGLRLHISCYTGTVVKLLICCKNCSQRVFERSSYKHFLNISIWQRWPVRKQVSQILKFADNFFWICGAFANILRICDLWTTYFCSLRICDLGTNKKKFACPPLVYSSVLSRYTMQSKKLVYLNQCPLQQ